MPTRYQQLRQAVARLAASADEQHAWLESILAPVSGTGSGRDYGNDELALELEDIYAAKGEMLRWGEISREEIDAIRPLDDFLLFWSGQENADFWRRDALWTDPRWEEARGHARRALAILPDEERPSDWMSELRWRRPRGAEMRPCGHCGEEDRQGRQ